MINIREVKVVKEVKRSDTLWCFACGDVPSFIHALHKIDPIHIHYIIASFYIQFEIFCVSMPFSNIRWAHSFRKLTKSHPASRSFQKYSWIHLVPLKHMNTVLMMNHHNSRRITVIHYPLLSENHFNNISHKFWLTYSTFSLWSWTSLHVWGQRRKGIMSTATILFQQLHNSIDRHPAPYSISGKIMWYTGYCKLEVTKSKASISRNRINFISYFRSKEYKAQYLT